MSHTYDTIWNGLLTTVDVVGISLSSYPKVNKAQEIKTKQKVVVLSIAHEMSSYLPYDWAPL